MVERARPMPGTIHVEALRVLLGTAEVLGMPRTRVVEAFDLGAYALDDLDTRVPVELATRLWIELPVALDAPDFGLVAAQTADAMPLSLGGRLVAASPTLGEGLARLRRFERVMHDVETTSLEVHGDATHIVFDTRGGVPVPFVAEVHRAVVRALARCDAALERVAAELGLAPRTLQRRLREHGVRYAAVLDQVRCAIALERIAALDASLAETAFALGFSDQSAFHRAFVRWTGTSRDRRVRFPGGALRGRGARRGRARGGAAERARRVVNEERHSQATRSDADRAQIEARTIVILPSHIRFLDACTSTIGGVAVSRRSSERRDPASYICRRAGTCPPTGR